MDSPGEERFGGIKIQGLVGKLKLLKNEALERRRQEEKAKYERKKRRERERYHIKKKFSLLKNKSNSLETTTNFLECSKSETVKSLNEEKKNTFEQIAMHDHQNSENIKKGTPKKRNRKNISTEEIRRREREKKRKQREKLKEDKNKLEELRKKDRERKRQKYVPISQSSLREQTKKRKKWRKWKQLEREAKKRERRMEEFVTNNSPPQSRSATPEIVRQNENTPPRPQQNAEEQEEAPAIEEQYYQDFEPSDSRKIAEKPDAIQKENDADKSRLLKKIKALNEKVRLSNHALHLEKSRSERYKKRLQSLRVSYTQNLKTPSPRTKVNYLVQRGDPKTIAKQLLIGEVLQHQIKKSSENCSSKCEEKIVSKVISGNVSKKYRVTKYLKGNISYHLYNQSLSQSDLLPARKVRTCAEVKKKIQDFFVSEEASVQAPGKKDCITFKKNKAQKRFLKDSVTNLYKTFKEKNENVSFTTFYKHKPFWVVRQKLEARNTCMCVRHANFYYILNKMLSLKLIFGVGKIHDLANALCCNTNSDLCLTRMCSFCAEKLNDLLTKDADLTKKVSYNKWETKFEKRIDKNRKEITVKVTTNSVVTSTVEEMMAVFKNGLKTILPHHFRGNHQQEQVRLLQTNVNQNEAVVTIDFSENYICKFNEEVQSVHFGGSRKQIALHTGAMHFKNKDGKVQCFSFAGVSDDLLHNAFAVWAYLKPVFDLLVEKKIKVVHFVSDGPTSQYKNKTNFQLFCYFAAHYGIDFSTWNFYEPGHGKSVADGIGGKIKRMADEAIIFGKRITSAQTFIDIVQRNTKIFLYQISTSDIDEVNILSSKLSDSTASVPNTMKIRQLIWSNKAPKCLILKHKSCLSCKVICEHYLLQPAKFIFENSLPDGCANKPNMEETCDSDEDNLPLSVMRAKNSIVSEKKKMICTEIKTGSWLLVTFPTEGPKEPSKLSYICQVSQIFDQKYQGKFLRKKSTRDHKGFVYGFPDVQDLFEFEPANIVEQLPDPEPYGRGLFKFDINTDFV